MILTTVDVFYRKYKSNEDENRFWKKKKDKKFAFEILILLANL